MLRGRPGIPDGVVAAGCPLAVRACSLHLGQLRLRERERAGGAALAVLRGFILGLQPLHLGGIARPWRLVLANISHSDGGWRIAGTKKDSAWRKS
jgi:hypothetical protein